MKINSVLNEQDLSDSIPFLFYNMQNNLFFLDISNDIKSLLYLTYSNVGICCNNIDI